MSIRWLRWLLPCLLLGILALGRQSWAVEPKRVIVFGSLDDRLAKQLRSELTATGYEPIAAEPPSESAPQAFLDDTARHYQAVGILNVVAGVAIVQVWATQPDRKLALVDMITQEQDSDTARSLVAARAVEALRAGLAKAVVRRPPTTPARSVPTAPPQEAPSSTFFVSAGPSLLLSPGGVGPLYGLDARFAWRLPPIVLLQLHGSLPLPSAKVDDALGTTRVSSSLLGASIGVGGSGGTGGYVAMEGGLLRLKGEGSAAAGGAGHVDSSSVGYCAVALGGRFALSSAVGVDADLTTGLMTSRVPIRHAGEAVAEVGLPFAALALGAHARW